MTTLFAPPPEIIRLATENPFSERLEEPAGSAERRSPLCGSRVIVDVALDDAGRVAAVGMRVNACAFGQAAATILARRLMGRSAAELAAVRDEVAAWMAGGDVAPEWPGIDQLRPDRLNAVRRASVQLAFQAAADAAARAAGGAE